MATSGGYKAKCDKWFKYWIQALGLEGWEVRVEYVHPLTEPEQYHGSCTVSRTLQKATVRITVPPLDERDLEQTIVHELLHIYHDLQDLKPDSYDYVRAEQGIDKTAYVLVHMRNKWKEALSNGSQTKPTKKRTSRKRR